MGAMAFSSGIPAEKDNITDTNALFSTLYFELYRLAKRELLRRWNPIGLSVTTLLHEAYLDMAVRNGPAFPDYAHFMGYAARVIRGLIVDHARNFRATKRGGKFEIIALDNDVIAAHANAKELSLLSDALDQLEKVEPELAQVVDLKYFCGFSFGEIAVMQGLSERTVQRRWEKARIYLHHCIGTDLSL